MTRAAIVRNDCQLFTNEMCDDTPPVRVGAMFPKINSLPRAKRKSSCDEGNAQVHRCERRAHVGGHIILSFSRMPEEPVAVRNEAFKEALQVTADLRIGIFLY